MVERIWRRLRDEAGVVDVPKVPILAALVSLVAIAAGLVLAILGVGVTLDEHSTPLVLTVLGFVGTITTNLVILLRVDRTDRAMQDDTIIQKSREGAHRAIAESEVVTRQGPVVQRQLAALDANTAALTTLLAHLAGDVVEATQARRSRVSDPHKGGT